MDSTVKACLLSLSWLSLATAQQFTCPYTNEYCEVKDTQNDIFVPPAADGVTTASTVDEVAELCYVECKRQHEAIAGACEGFSVYKFRGAPPTCYLLREACSKDIDDICLTMDTCVSGPNDCAATDVTCPILPPLPEGYARWQCVDIGTNQMNPYTEPPPVGTTCQQTCPSWVSANDDLPRLVSECLSDGTWSLTQKGGDGAELQYPLYPSGETNYPAPDADDTAGALTCGCEPLAVKWPYNDPSDPGYYYDPNAEEAAEFICDYPVQTNVWTTYDIETTNTCVLYCDDHYVATAMCLDGIWTGEPEWGFWCYTPPSQIADPNGL